MGANGIAKYLENHGIHKIARQNGKNPLFDAALIRRIIQNPVYSGKISYGRRRTEKVHGTRNEYRQVKKDDYLLVDGLHEALVSEEVWEQAQVKVAAQAKKYEKAENEGLKKRIREFETFLKEADQELTEYDETMVRKYIREIKVYEDHLLVCFEAGFEVEIDR